MKQNMDITGTPKEAVKPVKKASRQKPEKNLYEPYSTPRIAYEMIRWSFRGIIMLVAHVHLRGRYNIPKKGPYIIAANHLSWTDIPFIPAYLPGKVVYMAKEEAFYGRYGWLSRFLGAFPVKRGEGDRQAIRASQEQLKQKKVFVIFPEGTRSLNGTLGKAHAGLGLIALRAGVPVIPVAIWGSENALKKFGAHVTISYGEPILLKPKGSKVTREDIAEATDEVMKRIADMLPERYRGEYGNVRATPPVDTTSLN
jgi:1-acyl-sn-glycerol-3-phosphate acyltransferase